MKISNIFQFLPKLAAFVVIAAVTEAGSPPLRAADADAAQQRFATPEDAVKALKTATENKDKGALLNLFGPEFNTLATGDAVQDANNAAKFAAQMAVSCDLVQDGDDKVELEIGTNHWPMPIPLVKSGGQWRFDTAAGREEIISRHIGKDELHAIGACRSYVLAQKQYANLNRDTAGGVVYARKFKSSPGMRDGLYWATDANNPPSPFGPVAAAAQAEGYGKGSGTEPFHGYYFRILTRQGRDAPGGKMNYLADGRLTGGFALVAYPSSYGQSGIMTFMVNQDGKVYQRDLGGKTTRAARAIHEYNPDSSWTLTQDEGVTDAASEK